jgi:membrane-associated phospholipid phosphatase
VVADLETRQVQNRTAKDNGVTAVATSEALAAEPRTYRPLVPVHLRRAAVVVILLATLVLAVLAVRYAHQEAAGRLDRTLDIYIRTRLRQEQSLTEALIGLADPPHVAILVVALAGAAALARRWSGVMLLLGGTPTAVVISEVILKPLVGRLRYGHLTFPSGHATAMAAIATATAILLLGAQRPSGVALRLCASLAAIIVAASVAIALVAQHVHYATDTVAGCCVAVVTVLTMALGLDFLTPRIQSRYRAGFRTPSHQPAQFPDPVARAVRTRMPVS